MLQYMHKCYIYSFYNAIAIYINANAAYIIAKCIIAKVILLTKFFSKIYFYKYSFYNIIIKKAKLYNIL